MDRVKITLVVLLPVLWLTASGQRYLDPCGNCSASSSASVSSPAFENGQPCPSSETASVDLSARRLNARINCQLPKDNLFSVKPAACSRAFDPAFSAEFFSNRQGLL